MRVDAYLVAVAGRLFAPDPPGRVLSPHHVEGDLVDRQHVDRLQRLDLLVADAAGVERGRWLHEREREHLHDVVLHDVAQRARPLVEAPAVSHPELLGHGDLHVVDVAPVPDGLEDRVREAQGENVLDRLLPEVVVDAVHLLLGEPGVHDRVEVARARPVVPVRLLDDDAHERAFGRRPVEPVLGEPAHDHGERRGRRGEVVEPVAAGAALPVQLVEHGFELVERLGRRVVAGHVAEAAGERRPHRARLVATSPQLLDRDAHALAEVVVGHLGARHAHDREAGGQQPAQGEPLDRGHELATGEVA